MSLEFDQEQLASGSASCRGLQSSSFLEPFTAPIAWREVVQHLRAQGYKALMPALANVSTLQDSSKIAEKSSLDDTHSIHEHMLPELDNGTEVILVGHSYGSLPATIAVQGQTVDEQTARGFCLVATESLCF